ncbi:hypothetical protein [Crocinitomix catalasitica]|uniref:hypothetical protein n=1 Tax=Crocinitomix catalasitica TaxID=184607 RepID=UPI000A4C5F92|nr:hypothetical protein [Crocinitomix catalasitica]
MKGLIYILLTLTFISCSNCPENPELDTSCFSSVITKLTNDSVKKIDLGSELNCFQWDSIEIGGRGSYEAYPCMNFTMIENGKYAENGKVVEGSNLESEMDWFDRDGHWQMVYFYHNGKIQNEAFAISQSAVSFFDMTLNRGTIFLDKSESKFDISDRVLGGISGIELIEHRQMIKK